MLKSNLVKKKKKYYNYCDYRLYGKSIRFNYGHENKRRSTGHKVFISAQQKSFLQVDEGIEPTTNAHNTHKHTFRAARVEEEEKKSENNEIDCFFVCVGFE